jgi:membrane protein
MEGFRRCYELPKTWGLIKEWLIAFLLVIFALVPMTFATILVAVGSKFETRLVPYLDPDFSPYVLLLWGAIRWLIATLTSISVIALIYHNAVPRTQRWHSVMPGALLVTLLWFSVTVGFRGYLQHFGNFATIYGSLGVAMALLVWMYMISLVVLVGAEFNALLFPRAMLGKELTAISGPKAAD